MNKGRHLKDVFARRSLIQSQDGHIPSSHEEGSNNEYEEEISIESGRAVTPKPAQPNTTLMDMLMNGNRTTTITVGGSSNVSPAVLDYMRVTTQQKPKTPDTAVPIQSDSVPLEDMFKTRYAERMARIVDKIEDRDIDEFDEEFDDIEEEDRDSNEQRHGEMSGNEEEDEDDIMMREMMGTSPPRRARGGGNMQPPARKKQRTRAPPTKDNCFLCQFGDRFHDGIRAPQIARLNQIIDKFYGRVSNYTLANFIHLYFKEKIYNEDEGMHMLEPHVVLEHIEGRHSLAALNFIVESIHDYEQVKFIAKGCLCKADGSMDHRAFATFDKAQTKLEKLYTMDIDKMNFNNGQTKEDLNSKGAYFNLMPMFSQKEEQYRRLKRKAAAIESATNTFDS